MIGTGEDQLENEEFIREFLEESEENLDQLDQDFVALEQEPGDLVRLDSIYRAIHTIKGTSGFFGFSKLGAVTHSAENLLSRLRDGEITLNEALTSALLKSVDAVREILANIGRDGEEGDGNYRTLNQQLDDLSITSPPIDSAKTETQGIISTTQEHTTGEIEEGTIVAPLKSDSNSHEIDSVLPLDGAGTYTSDDETLQPGDSSGSEVSPPSSGAASSVANVADSDPPITGINPILSSEDSPSVELLTGGDAAPIKPHASGTEGSIRVDVTLLNQLMDLVGELVLARNQLLQTESHEHDHRLSNVTQQVNRITTELQERVMQTRMQPIGNIWGKFPRLVRDLAVICGKEIDLLMNGQETEVDKSLLEAIKDPLTHLIRNAIDHGIESTNERLSCGKNKRGQLHLRAWHQGGQVNIEISDNGQGIDPAIIREKALSKNLISASQGAEMSDQQLVQLIFCPGFSTAAEVTGISGRGVGMDVVKTNIESIGGTIDVQSRIGTGTAIKVKIPLTLAIIPALIISSNQQRFAIPQGHLVEMIRLDLRQKEDRIEKLRDTPVYRLRGRLLPIVYLSQLLGGESVEQQSETTHVNIAVLQADNCRFGLVVDHVERTEEIVVKALHPSLSVIQHLAGATVMGDGRVALILDVMGLANDIGLTPDELKQASELNLASAPTNPTDQMLIFKLLSGRKLAMPLSDVDRLEDFPLASIEQADRMAAVQYRGHIMPLLPLADLLGEPEQKLSETDTHVGGEDETIKAIVFNFNGNQAGITVREIVDVADQQGPMRMTNAPENPIRGSAVIEGKVTDVLDIGSILKRYGIDEATNIGASV